MDELTPTTEVETPLETTEAVINVEQLHAMFLELQAQVLNLQVIADQATPVEPAAVEEEPSLEGDLLEENPVEEPALEEINELDKLLQEN